MKTKTLFVVAGIVLFLVGLMLLIFRAIFKKLGKKPIISQKPETCVLVIDKERLDRDGYNDHLYDNDNEMFNEVEKQLREHFGHECYISISEKEIEIKVNNNNELSEEECCRIIDEVLSEYIEGYYYYVTEYQIVS